MKNVNILYYYFLIKGAVLQNQELYQACVAVYEYDDKLCEPMLGVIPKNATSQVSTIPK